MSIEFADFLSQLLTNPSLCIISLLISGVILVNGWTDAPNAIATCVSTRSLSPKKSIILAAVFNFLGVFTMTLINSTVAQTIYNIVDFGNDSVAALTALSAALVAIVTWAVLAWLFGIPTSESHALIAGLSGAAIAIQGGIAGINGAEWVKVLYGMVISTILGFGMGYSITKLIEVICKKIDRRKTIKFFKHIDEDKKKKNRIIGTIIIIIGFLIKILSMILIEHYWWYDTDYAILAFIIILIGISYIYQNENIKKLFYKIFIGGIICLAIFTAIDISEIKIKNIPPRYYSYNGQNNHTLVYYKTPFYDAYVCLDDVIHQNVITDYTVVPKNFF